MDAAQLQGQEDGRYRGEVPGKSLYEEGVKVCDIDDHDPLTDDYYLCMIYQQAKTPSSNFSIGVSPVPGVPSRTKFAEGLQGGTLRMSGSIKIR